MPSLLLGARCPQTPCGPTGAARPGGHTLYDPDDLAKHDLPEDVVSAYLTPTTAD